MFWMEFFYDVSDEPHIAFNQFISCVFIALCKALQASCFFFFR